MVGLPATGKTHTSKRIQRFLGKNNNSPLPTTTPPPPHLTMTFLIEFFHDIPCQIFNVGEYRRKICGINMPASFYDNDNKEGESFLCYGKLKRW